MPGKTEKIYNNHANNIYDFSLEYFNYLHEIFNKISKDEINQFIQLLKDARKSRSKIFFIGNGGSASTASHFANDLNIGTKTFSNPFRAISLTDNNAIITALGNDIGYKYIFSHQINSLANKEDTIVMISASGNSENLILACEKAKKIGAKTIGLTAFDGGKIKELVDFSLHVPTEIGDYGPAEDIHLIINHISVSYLMNSLKKK